MIIIGDDNIPFKGIMRVKPSKLDFSKMKESGKTCLFSALDFDLEVFAKCREKNIPFAVTITNITQLIYAAAAGADYVVVGYYLGVGDDTLLLLKELLEVAKKYNLKTKIFVTLDDSPEILALKKYNDKDEVDWDIFDERMDELEGYAEVGVDGVIYSDYINLY